VVIRPALRAGLASVTFLTIVPVATRVVLDSVDVARGAVLFPVVGGLIGALGGSVAYALAGPTSPLVAAAAAVAVMAAVTGALHLDGLADFADGFGGRTVEDRLRIMRDHTVGAYGATTLLLDLLIKAAAFTAVAGTGHAVAVGVAAGAASRSCGPVLAAVLPYAQTRTGAGGALHTDGAGRRALATVLVTAAVVAAAVGWAGWRVALGCVVACVLVGGSARRRLGGVTGDVMGAACELAELAALVALMSTR
jgi:cobalamin 5'-phosphate synthase/cobalamin synthase